LLILLGTVWKLQGKIWSKMSCILSTVICFWLLLSDGSEDHLTSLILWLRHFFLFSYTETLMFLFSIEETHFLFSFSTILLYSFLNH
jgi:uncharacterized membrane protein HdeD (DUF308 family)